MQLYKRRTNFEIYILYFVIIDIFSNKKSKKKIVIRIKCDFQFYW